ncbi:MAG: hypothetical protein A2Z99_12065 [Treponema sp. GWB1_62_6]|nr:MAG: hypothetical protein A2Y36_16155 [Treponema sp. GWA1_62_8]OHE65779.1 MAG: hypothetical protein A2Z99_12065 [Treponema sp. GWB1_62_6]OHE67851.1 MAG: hypothetical protein A2001_20430 [Treponema sp. GWC1_61_84]HCM27298.1 hypothetical protein [Treponema sp.]
MKFKYVFALFNAVVGLSFLFVFAMPFLALGGAYAATFWSANWPLAFILAAILAAIDLFFLGNWRLFALLEQEDWPALAHYLEERVIKRKRWSPRLVRLLANTYLVLSDSAAVASLEAKVAAAKPDLLDKNALVFGVARVLANDNDVALDFFRARRGKGRAESPEWIEWYYAFTLLLSRRFEEAADVLSVLSRGAKDAIVAALASSFLVDSVSRALPDRAAELAEAASEGRSRVLAKFPNRAAWEKEIEKSRAEIHVVVLTKSIGEAADRLYA